MLLGGMGLLSGGDVPRPAASMAQPLRFGQIGLAPPQGLVGALTITDVLDVGDEPGRPAPLIGQRRARQGGIEFRPVLAHDPYFETRESCPAIEPRRERRPSFLDLLRHGNSTPDDVIGSPADEALECRVASLDGLVSAE